MDEHTQPPADTTDELPNQTPKNLADQVAEVDPEEVGDVVLGQVGVVGRRFGVGAAEVVEVVGGVANLRVSRKLV